MTRKKPKLTPAGKKAVRGKCRQIVTKQAEKCHAKTKSIKAFRKCMKK